MHAYVCITFFIIYCFILDDSEGSGKYRVLQKNYAALCDTMTDIDEFLQYFVAENIINTEEEEKIRLLDIKSRKVGKLLMHINGPLKAGDESGLYTMLRIMKMWGLKATQTLSDNIAKDLLALPNAEHRDSKLRQQEDQEGLLS